MAVVEVGDLRIDEKGLIEHFGFLCDLEQERLISVGATWMAALRFPQNATSHLPLLLFQAAGVSFYQIYHYSKYY